MALAATEEELAFATFVQGRIDAGRFGLCELGRTAEGAWTIERDRSLDQGKLRRGTFTATFLLAPLAALEMEGMRLEDL